MTPEERARELREELAGLGGRIEDALGRVREALPGLFEDLQLLQGAEAEARRGRIELDLLGALAGVELDPVPDVTLPDREAEVVEIRRALRAASHGEEKAGKLVGRLFRGVEALKSAEGSRVTYAAAQTAVRILSQGTADALGERLDARLRDLYAALPESERRFVEPPPGHRADPVPVPEPRIPEGVKYP